MVFTLQRYILRELLKVFVLATIALSLILSLGSVLRPIQQYGVGPRQVVSLLWYFMPITLTFVLPMAALFAAALIYGRFAADNELDACRASGISLFTMVYPGLALAIVVAMATLTLSFYVVPAYVQRAEKAVKADAKQILFRNIQRRGYYNLPDGRYRVYADLADERNNQLLGVVVAETKDGLIEQLIVAETADIQFVPHEQYTEVTIFAHNLYKIDSEFGVYMEWLPVSTEFGSLLADNIKFKKIRQMKAIRSDFTQFYPVANLARAAYTRLAVELLADSISSKIADTQDRFYRLGGKDRRTGENFFIEFTAARCSLEGEATVKLAGQVTILQYDAASGAPVCTWQCAEAELQPVKSVAQGPLSGLAMSVRNATQQANNGSRHLAYRHTFAELDWPQAVSRTLKPDLLETVESASLHLKNPTSTFTSLCEELKQKITRTEAQIKAEMHSRMVFGLGCIPMILISMALGIRFKGGHLLSAFGASTAPAGALVVCIMTGRNITKNPAIQANWGTGLMWASLAALAVLAIVLHRRLLRN
jgi:lipopolysaccharide export LptBFGC system permease protein LptF